MTSPPPRLRFVELQSDDLARACDFYHGGFGLRKRRGTRRDSMQPQAGTTHQCLDVRHEDRGPMLIFAVNDHEAFRSCLREAPVQVTGPRRYHGRRHVTVRDPDGNLLVFEDGR